MNKNIKDLAKVFQKCKEEGNGLPIIFIGDNINLSKDSSLIQETIKEHKERYNKTESGFKTAIEYIYLTKLFNSEYFDSIYISNFDSLLFDISNLFNAFSLNIDEPETLKEQYKQLSNISDYKNILENNKDKPWVFVGCNESGLLFEELLKIKIFNNELFWIDASTYEKVSSKLLSKRNITFIKSENVENTFLKLYSILDLNFQKKTIKEKTNEDSFYPLSDFVYNNWGNTLFKLARENNDIEFLKDGANKYKKAISINPKSTYYFNLGTITREIALFSKDKSFFYNAIESFKKAVEIDPNNGDFYNNWGISLSQLGEIENNEKLLLDGIEKFKKCLTIKESREAYANWGLSLILFANKKKDKNLFLDGIEKFKKAIDLNPNDCESYNSWGEAIAQLAELTNNESLYSESLFKLKTAYSLGKNNSYNIAYAYTRMGDKENGLKFLKICIKQDINNKKIIKEDKIWVTYKNNQEFIKIMNSK